MKILIQLIRDGIQCMLSLPGSFMCEFNSGNPFIALHNAEKVLFFAYPRRYSTIITGHEIVSIG